MANKKTRVVIMGAAGRDFHNFNVFFRDNADYEVVAITAEQIPGIEGRTYPPELAGKLYPKGIPILPEEDLEKIIREKKVDQVILAYSDLSFDYVMKKASQIMAWGADFRLMGADDTMLKSKKPLVSICAVRTGVGKSQTTRRVCEILKKKGRRIVVIRHPMPYGDLREQIWQRYETYDDMKKHKCTIEEMEEYEPHIEMGNILYAGVDYGEILRRAEKEADVVIWDGGNNDLPFYKPDLHIVLVDPHRPGHEMSYYPGMTNLLMADVALVNKVDTAKPENVNKVRENIKKLNPKAKIILANSPPVIEGDANAIKGKRVLVVEDGPTVTHGGMPYGAGAMAVKKVAGTTLVDPRPYAVGSIKKTFEKYPHLINVLPAMGYGKKQVAELEETIMKTPCDVVVIGTPIDLRKVVKLTKPTVRVRYNLEEIKGELSLEEVLRKF